MLLLRAWVPARSFARCYSALAQPSSLSPSPAPDRTKAKADWKRRQEGSNFVDTLNLAVVSGRGGAGGVAFHREKFKARGPPSGGPGGAGGSVYLVASPSVTNLSHLPRTVRGGAGSPGGGSWLAGKRGEDVVLRVPVGTIVREVRREPKDEDAAEVEREEREQLEWAYEANKIRLAEAEARDVRWKAWKKRRDKADKFGNPDDVERWEEVDEVEIDGEKLVALEQLRKALFVMYPQTELEGHPHFLRTEHELLSKLLSREIEMPDPKQRRRRQRRRRNHGQDDDQPLFLDLTKPTPLDQPVLLVAGGQPGLGNPSFLTHEDRSPKYATRGGDGEMMRLELEVKSTGEVGLVGLPNAGKSTLLRALTSSTPRVASYAFTTLNPHHGTCILWSDGTFSGPRPSPASATSADITDTPATPEYFSASSQHQSRAERRRQLGPSASATDSSASERTEVLRFTLTDNPGLVASSSLNVGLGHAFLRHIERCSALVYVVDLSSADPREAIASLRAELAAYARVKGLAEGELEGRIRGVVANKADLFGAPSPLADEAASADEEEARASPQPSPQDGQRKLADLTAFVRALEAEDVARGVRQAGDEPIWVVPVSAMRRENVAALVGKLAGTVRAERERAARRDELAAIEAEEERQRATYERWMPPASSEPVTEEN
ncbi:putative GTPase MTG2 [Rhodotorula paludigena]|uniref:putative GTPase MTG2 n=1 Tax=Rhodotorula paludigena TaxID=86838 RepID=UPI0031818CAC